MILISRCVLTVAKFARQAQQDEDEELRHELDQELDSLRSLLYAPDPTAPSTSSAPDVEAATAAPAAISLPTDEKDQEYDQIVRELAFEKRAKPKDRTKTEEELALEEKEALEKAERRRLKRMRGEPEESDEEGGGKKKRRERGGDDLEDDFMDEDEDLGGLGVGLGGHIEDASDGDEGEEDTEGDEDEDDEDDGDSEDENDVASDYSDSEGEGEGEEGDSEALVKTGGRSKSSKAGGKKKELPFTFPCPSTHDEFLEIVEDIDDADIPTVIKRIRTLHHPSLAQDNKFKLQVRTQRTSNCTCLIIISRPCLAF